MEGQWGLRNKDSGLCLALAPRATIYAVGAYAIWLQKKAVPKPLALTPTLWGVINGLVNYGNETLQGDFTLISLCLLKTPLTRSKNSSEFIPNLLWKTSL